MKERRESGDSEPVLMTGENGVELSDGNLALTADFSRLLPRIRPERIGSEMLVKAAKIKGESDLFVVDATAGLGDDSFILAAAGFRVLMIERDKTVFTLLSDALQKAREDPGMEKIAGRMEAICGDSIDLLQNMIEKPDIVLLDPMFPKRKKSGLVKKKFQLIHQLEAPCTEEEKLLQAAMAAKPKRIVIKRPQKGPNLAGVKPSYTIEGKAIRYDCIVL